MPPDPLPREPYEPAEYLAQLETCAVLLVESDDPEDVESIKQRFWNVLVRKPSSLAAILTQGKGE